MDNVSGNADNYIVKKETKQTKQTKTKARPKIKLNLKLDLEQLDTMRTNLLSKYSNHADKNLNDAILNLDLAINSLNAVKQ